MIKEHGSKRNPMYCESSSPNRAVRAVGLPPTRYEDKVAQTQTSGRSMFLSPPGKGGMKS